MRKLCTVVLLLAFIVSITAANTFYIDYAGGSNSNPGTKVSPWKSHPYMNCGPAPTYTHSAGDQFIFKGGVTWPVGCFNMSITLGGSAGNVDYYGVDQTWFSGGSFTQPKFDLANSVPAGNNVITAPAAFGGYVTFDDLSIVNQGITIDGGGVNGAAFQFDFVTGSMPGVTIQYVSMNDWTSTTDVATLPATGPGSGWTYASGCIKDGHNRVTVNHVICDDTNGYVYASAVKHNVGWGGGCENCGTVENSVFRSGFAGCFTVGNCHDNEFSNIKQTAADLCPCRPHSQVIEDDFGAIIGMKAYNNYIHDNNPVGVTIYVNYSALVYNNVMKNNSNGNIMIGEPGGSHIGSGHPGGYALNNTGDGTNGIPCFATDSKGTIPGPFTRNNNICVTNGSETSIVSAISSFTNGPNNYKMSTAEANTYGFTAANQYNPTSADPAVVGRGTVYSSLCSSLPGLCSDKNGNARLTTWDLGAYEFGGAVAAKPNPPANLTATVQ